MNLYVDGEKICHQEADTFADYIVTLEEGNHEVYLKTDATYRTDKIKIDVNADGQIFYFEAKTKLTFGIAFDLVTSNSD